LLPLQLQHAHTIDRTVLQTPELQLDPLEQEPLQQLEIAHVPPELQLVDGEPHSEPQHRWYRGWFEQVHVGPPQFPFIDCVVENLVRVIVWAGPRTGMTSLITRSIESCLDGVSTSLNALLLDRIAAPATGSASTYTQASRLICAAA